MSTPSPAADAVASGLFRALAVLRIVVLLNALALAAFRAETFVRPGLAVACLALMTGWTAFAVWAYASPSRRTAALLVADLVTAGGLVLVTPLVKGPDFHSSVPGFWVMGALLAWAIRYRTVGGLVAGVLLAAADLALRRHVGQGTYGNEFLLVVGGPIVGFMCESLQQMATQRDAAERTAAAAEERARLARAVHDGVLQVLALVQRHGRDHAEAAELGELAAEQEHELRTLIRAQRTGADAHEDLTTALAALEHRGRVTVALPAGPVTLPATYVREIVAATRACLDNVRLHVGADAQAYVLLQALPDRIEVSVRDDGPGIEPGRLEAAAREGRLGVTESIRGRIDALGGRAEISTGAFGTEWDLVIDRPEATT